ncbi:MAG: hypothetical protein CVT48_04805 [Thermoplasmata archaeon HGW-Thermoplasmata-1]|nr:MAG: hypothetical protein CVT48_04805 [Thermoplasmata archaeon HGW-Thermoplasmata-1]
MPANLNDLDPKMQRLLKVKPLRAEVEWDCNDDGFVVVTIPKNFNKFERFVRKFIKGPDNVRFRFDKHGTDVWNLCDGGHSLGEICDFMWDKYHEEMEPVLKRVWQFVQMLMQRGLCTLKE